MYDQPSTPVTVVMSKRDIFKLVGTVLACKVLWDVIEDVTVYAFNKIEVKKNNDTQA